MQKIILLIASFVLCSSVPCRAENYTVHGRMHSRLRYSLTQEVERADTAGRVSVSLVVPTSFRSPTYQQEISALQIDFTPAPSTKENSTDRHQNRILTATWKRPPPSLKVTLACQATNSTTLEPLRTEAPFPLPGQPAEFSPYLSATAQVQADDRRIRSLAKRLTAGVSTEFDAVQRILTWVVDNMRYVNPPAQYDALYALESGRGNCQNFSHLGAALLRSVGIPVRIVNGFTLDRPYSIERPQGPLTFKMGLGRHSWVEVWFPDLGWVPFDPQQTELFVSNRYLRIEVGVDNSETINDGLLRWVQPAGSRRRPTMAEQLAANFASDRVSLSGERQQYGPRNLLLCPPILTAFTRVPLQPPPSVPAISPSELRRLQFTRPLVFGNLEFPENVDFAFPRQASATSGANVFQMTRNFLVETAEYVTTKLIQYAQIFVLPKPLKLQNIGLALHKYGGSGVLWVELRQDDGGQPGQVLATSDLVDLQELSGRPGYRWVDFDFKQEALLLAPGGYWIALGFTGSPIVNWFYTYGKPVGPVEGTRYKGVFDSRWSGALNYEFNYRVVGLTVP